jgi:hypothetical protein
MRSLSSPSVSSPTIRTDCSCPRHFTTSVISSATEPSAAAPSAGTGADEDEAASSMGFGCADCKTNGEEGSRLKKVGGTNGFGSPCSFERGGHWGRNYAAWYRRDVNKPQRRICFTWKIFESGSMRLCWTGPGYWATETRDDRPRNGLQTW